MCTPSTQKSERNVIKAPWTWFLHTTSFEQNSREGGCQTGHARIRVGVTSLITLSAHLKTRRQLFLRFCVAAREISIRIAARQLKGSTTWQRERSKRRYHLICIGSARLKYTEIDRKERNRESVNGDTITAMLRAKRSSGDASRR